jgi:hypothetical protein
MPPPSVAAMAAKKIEVVLVLAPTKALKSFLMKFCTLPSKSFSEQRKGELREKSNRKRSDYMGLQIYLAGWVGVVSVLAFQKSPGTFFL